MKEGEDLKFIDAFASFCFNIKIEKDILSFNIKKKKRYLILCTSSILFSLGFATFDQVILINTQIKVTKCFSKFYKILSVY